MKKTQLRILETLTALVLLSALLLPAALAADASERQTQSREDDAAVLSSDSYTISVPAGGSVRGGSIAVSGTSARAGETVTVTVQPADGYLLKAVTVTDQSGSAMELHAVSGTQYTFTMPEGAVSVGASFLSRSEGGSTAFDDVPLSHWASHEIQWVYESGYMNGTTATRFDPEGTVTRQQIWMILARMAGAAPADLSAARIWAINTGISDGSAPGGTVTRQQMVTLLYRFAELYGYDTDARVSLSEYRDADSLAGYAVEPMSWAVANSIVGGTADGALNAGTAATRAQFAVALWRFFQTTAV